MPDLIEIHAMLATLNEKMDNALTLIEKNVSMNEKKHEDHELRLRILERNSIRYDQRLNIQTGILGTLTVIGSSIAAYLGIKN